jgi:hypothetical protein
MAARLFRCTQCYAVGDIDSVMDTAGSIFAKLRSTVSDKIRTNFTSSEYVYKINQVITDDNWGPTPVEMDDLARLYPDGYYDFLPEMQLRLDQRDTNWRKCYKTLRLIDHFARVLDDRYLEDLRAFLPTLREIDARYHFKDSAGTDCGITVRERAKKIIEILNNPAKLHEEREKTDKARRAMGGGGGMEGIGSARYGGFGSGGSAAATPPSNSIRSGAAASIGTFLTGLGVTSLGGAATTGGRDTSDDWDMKEGRRRADQEAADRRVALALQEEEDARARVEAKRRARGDAHPSRPAALSSSKPAHDHDDDFGELQAAETAAVGRRGSAKADDEDEFGAFVNARVNGAPANSTSQRPQQAAPPAAAPAPGSATQAKFDLDYLTNPTTPATPAVAPSLDDIFSAPGGKVTTAPKQDVFGAEQPNVPVGQRVHNGPQSRAW